MRQDVALILGPSTVQSDLHFIPNRKSQIGVRLYAMSSIHPGKVSWDYLSILKCCGLQIFQMSLKGGA